MKRREPTSTVVDELQLATLVATPPEGDEWIHEQKFDGYRIVADKRGDDVVLMSRNFKPWTDNFPEIAAAVGRLRHDRVVLDGEVAMLMPDGRTSFQGLHGSGGELVYFVFDVLQIDDDAVMTRPLVERKKLLQKLVPKTGPIRYSDHVEGSGAAFFALACKQGLEGIISKRRDKPYASGRTKDWVKTKCIQRQELVIGGFTEPTGSRVGVGALLVGYYEKGQLVYAGKVGTGFTQKTLADITEKLTAIETTTCPFSPAPPRASTGKGVHWVQPEYVAEVAYLEWTADGRLRHPSFQGLRFDKDPTQVGRV
ncbi:MAG TPA: non-homologous end-joining DNA ligase [Kofleriaceae bacterium]|jgi:bifunctional non-homologous end joining protein LigD